jgi:CheY-like chemotaxis protein
MAKILVVDDSPVDQRLVGRLLEQLGHADTLFADDGDTALATIAREQPDLVLTDLQMPRMDGLELVRESRSNHASVPVIVMTAYGSEEIAIRALQSGAAYYVPKKNLANDLPETVESVLASASDLKLQHRLFAQLQQTESQFCLDNDISLIPATVNYLKESLARMKLLDDTGLIRTTVALREALMNAIVHGNLGVDSQMREHDLDGYYRAIDTRRMESPYRERRVHLIARESSTEARYVIRDEGQGFDPAQIPDPTDPSNMERASGRGLLLIRTFMDEVSHNAKGNEITMIKRRDTKRKKK